jgi:hypothetical protein
MGDGPDGDKNVTPAKTRGRYFHATAYMQMSGLQLYTNFSVMAWIRPDAVDAA